MDGQTEPHGEGAELRSDQAVANWGGEDVLITADAAPGGKDSSSYAPG